MKNKISTEEKKDLTCRLAVAFREEIRNLSKEYQEILLDDLVTAFQNRIAVFNRISIDKYSDSADAIEFHCKTTASHLENNR